MSFYTHGDLSFKVEGNIMLIEGERPWNLEAINSSADNARTCHEQLYGKPWGVLAIIHGDPIHTPDAAKLLTEIVIRDKQNGRTASALVLDEDHHPDFGKFHIGEIYGNAGETFEFFNDINSARKWLNEKLKN